ncbi:MAG TPA: exodeoxyribonuclease VII large subunit [Gammaproteobacteria bacterium]|nr:exodeoxyribonuclease VII large subunit [Gammaproteobacteria bacterium]
MTPDLFDRKIYSVSELGAAARMLLEEHFPSVWIQGEISNLARPGSGHWYFTLKDDAAQVRCAMFRMDNRRVRFTPKDGMLILLRARVSLYPQRGDFQLICQSMEPAGEGALRQAFEALKEKLAAEGLFDEASKRPLPALPRTIGVITSPTGAAIRDILSTLARRWPLARVRLYPTAVQGAQAAPEICAALARASADAACDLLILARGGGSLEDLWAFNDEALARAIRASAIPVIAGIGHEIDFTIADFAADLRAPTPTGAAEHAVPDQRDVLQTLAERETRLVREFDRRLCAVRERIDWATRRLDQLHPRVKLQQQAQRLDELTARLRQCSKARLNEHRQHFARVAAELRQHTPWHRLQTMNERLCSYRERLRFAIRQSVTASRNHYLLAARGLDTVSPLATLERGYAIVSDADGRTLTDAAAVRVDDEIRARLSRGELVAKVKHVGASAARDS